VAIACASSIIFKRRSVSVLEHSGSMRTRYWVETGQIRNVRAHIKAKSRRRECDTGLLFCYGSYTLSAWLRPTFPSSRYLSKFTGFSTPYSRSRQFFEFRYIHEYSLRSRMPFSWRLLRVCANYQGQDQYLIDGFCVHDVVNLIHSQQFCDANVLSMFSESSQSNGLHCIFYSVGGDRCYRNGGSCQSYKFTHP
jgi:hypothetical protein